MENSPEVHEGGCLCGRLRLRTQGPPRWQAVCHCRFCQRLTGSAFNAEAVFARDDVAFSGEPQVFDYRSPDHGRVMTVQFCGHCGVAVGLRFERFPAVQAVLVGVYDDPSWVRFDKHIFTCTALPWMAYREDMDVFDGHSIGAEGVAPQPKRAAVRSGSS